MSRVRVVDKGATRVVRSARELARAPLRVDVGIMGDDASTEYVDGITTALVAEIHEQGWGVPKRSWLRGWIEENEDDIDRRMSAFTRQILTGKITPEVAAKRFGAWAVGEIQKRISQGISPPNAPSTVESKGSSMPLIDTGQLRSSITSRTVRQGGGDK